MWRERRYVLKSKRFCTSERTIIAIWSKARILLTPGALGQRTNEEKRGRRFNVDIASRFSTGQNERVPSFLSLHWECAKGDLSNARNAPHASPPPPPAEREHNGKSESRGWAKGEGENDAQNRGKLKTTPTPIREEPRRDARLAIHHSSSSAFPSLPSSPSPPTLKWVYQQ